MTLGSGLGHVLPSISCLWRVLVSSWHSSQIVRIVDRWPVLIPVYSGISIPVNWSAVYVHRLSKLIDQNSSGENDAKEQGNEKPKEKYPEHHPCELFSEHVPIVFIHLLIGSSILPIVLRLIILIMLVMAFPLIKPLPCLRGCFGFIVLYLKFFI